MDTALLLTNEAARTLGVAPDTVSVVGTSRHSACSENRYRRSPVFQVGCRCFSAFAGSARSFSL